MISAWMLPFAPPALTTAPSWPRCLRRAAGGGRHGPSGDVSEVLARPELAHYVAGWPRPGDSGVIAAAARPVGAAWLRFLPDSDPGYGFIDVATPELSMGILPAWRGRGVGTRLLEALLAQARRAGLSTLSLSVERDNRARGLYERAGFRTVNDAGGAVTMLLRL